MADVEYRVEKILSVLHEDIREYMDEYWNTRIIVHDGEIFEGTRSQFANCFFSNATDLQIIDWCRVQEFKLTIDDIKIY